MVHDEATHRPSSASSLSLSHAPSASGAAKSETTGGLKRRTSTGTIALLSARRALRKRSVRQGSASGVVIMRMRRPWSARGVGHRVELRDTATHTYHRLSALRDEMRHGGGDELRAAVGASVEGPE